MALMATLSAFAITGMNSWLDKRELSGSATSVQSGLRAAQQQAMAEATSVCVSFADAKMTLFVGRCDAPTRTRDRVLLELPDQVEVDAPRFTYPEETRSEVTFTPRGTATPGTVRLLSAGVGTRTITIEGLTGRVLTN